MGESFIEKEKSEEVKMGSSKNTRGEAVSRPLHYWGQRLGETISCGHTQPWQAAKLVPHCKSQGGHPGMTRGRQVGATLGWGQVDSAGGRVQRGWRRWGLLIRLLDALLP